MRGPSSEKPPRDDGRAVVTIEAMGAQGHGVAQAGGAKVFVPFALPGENVRIELRGSRAEAVEIESPSPDRVQPVCRHFGACGGCSLQHWRAERYSEWKEGLVTSALARAGIAASIEPLKSYPPSSRRRATFTARSAGGKIELGYLSERTHALIDLEECPVLLPQLAAVLAPLKAALKEAMPPRSEAKIYAVAAENGLDCAIEGPRLSAAAATKLMQALSGAGFIRAAWNKEMLLLAAPPFVTCGDVRVSLPPGVFLQAAAACERDMAAWVAGALAQAGGPLCDLFAGIGAFTFPAAKLAAVTAYEENADAVAVLTAAAKRAKGIKPVAAIRRDLYRNPLGLLELNKFAAAIVDPPREGAEAQARALAASKATTVAMLSCNPATFARDAAILTGGGFQLARLACFDQFRFTAHVEIAAVFLRSGGKRR